MESDSIETAEPDWLSRNWKLILLIIWLLTCVAFIIYRWNAIKWFALGDTDDNMRIMQVRALLGGQDWYDLRQYRLNPPLGANIHWSHLVDLPIAAIILAVRPFFGGPVAEQTAIALAPMLPLCVAFTGLALTARRLIAPGAYILAAPIFVCFFGAMTMFMPTRIDHHGWQLAMLTIILAGLADPKPLRGGLTIGTATALSLVIGMETLPWLAVAGAGVMLRWLIAPEQSPRLRGYALSLGGSVAGGYVLFASEANRLPRCDALTPVWLSTMMLVAAGCFLLSVLKVERRSLRIGLASALAIVLTAFFIVAWPDCLGRPEQVSPELQKLWLDNINEAKPIYTRNAPTLVSTSVLLIGLLGSFWALWRHRSEEKGAAWATIALLSLGSALILFWQVRATPTALMFSVPGAAALAWAVLPRLRASNSVFVRTLGVVAAFLIFSGLALQFVAGQLPENEKVSPRMRAVARANAACPSLPALQPIAQLPKTTIFTFVDLSPRLITVTHHNAIAGPYHRNGDAILDVHHAFRGSAEGAREIMKRHGATMLLICPMMSESTVYRAQNPDGFYARLSNGVTPSWLTPVPLPARSPFKLWRIAS